MPTRTDVEVATPRCQHTNAAGVRDCLKPLRNSQARGFDWECPDGHRFPDCAIVEALVLARLEAAA